jgi:FO synthase subunit 1
VSPITDDHINPDYAWPALETLRDIADYAGVSLSERLPVYERYLPAALRDGTSPDPPASRPRGGRAGDGWISARIRQALAAEDVAGERYRTVIADGSPPA